MIQLIFLTSTKIKKGALHKILPELYELKNIYEQNEMHNHDEVFTHVVNVFLQAKKIIQSENQLQAYFKTVVGGVSRQELLLWSALLHDIAKKETFRDYGDHTECPNHEKLGVIKAKKILTRLKFRPQALRYILEIVAVHGQPHEIFFGLGQNSQLIKAAFRKFKQAHQEIFIDSIILVWADTLATQYRQNNLKDFQFRVKIFQNLLV